MATRLLKFIVLLSIILNAQIACKKTDLEKGCFTPYIDFVAYNVDPSTLEVSFIGVTTLNGLIKSQNWDFGDGITYSGNNPPVHKYPPLSITSPSKTYNIKYTVENDCGISYWTKDIKVSQCLANVKFSYSFVNDSIVSFINQTNSATPATYLWDFGDGTNSTSTATSFTKIYKQSGNFNISLKATNSCGENFYNQVIPINRLPGLTTVTAKSITYNSAVSGGTVIDYGGSTITSKGVCWSTLSNPTISNSKTSDGSGTTSYSSQLTGLLSNTLYYARAYASTNLGIVYGNQITFTTLIALPVLITLPISSITPTSAISGGNVSNDNGSIITSRGICWNTTNNPTIINSKTLNGTGLGSFNSNLSGLIPNTVYYIRAYAANSGGTSYGNEVSFTTSGTLVTLTTSPASAITSSSAVSGGNISNDGGLQVMTRGICYNTSPNPTITNTFTVNNSGLANYSSTLINLVPNTTYYVRAYATNAVGTAYGNQITFTSLPYAVGGTGPAGGFIFYDQGSYLNGWRFLEAASGDQSNSASWGCSGTNVNVATGIGDGLANTAAIVNSCATLGIAARLSDQLVLNGFNEWFLPSYSELNLMYQNLKAKGLGNFSNSYYWNSSQINSAQTYVQDFTTGNIYVAVKTSNISVRSVRRF